MVQINLRDAQGKPLANAKVTLSLQQKTQFTNESGIATFESVAPGKQTAKIEGQGVNQTEEIEVKDDPQSVLGTKDARAQTFSLIASAKHSQVQDLPLVTPIAVAVVIVIIVALLMVVKKVRRKSAGPQTQNS